MNSRSIITFLIIAIAALLVVYYFLGTGYLRQQQAQEALTAQIAGAARALARTPMPPPGLEQKLAAAEASLAATQGAFPADINSTRTINAILKLADDCRVSAIPLVTKPWTEENTGKYRVFRLNVTASGSFSQLAGFVSRLESGELGSLVVENLGVTRGAGATGETAVTASLALVVYTQPTASK